MQDINTIITKNFNDNIEYLQNNHPELFIKLSEYDAAISNGHYIEKYELVYENDNFDVLEKSTQKYLYNKQTTHHTKEALKTLEYSTLNNCFEGFFRQSYTKEQVALYTKRRDASPLEFYASYVADILHETEKKETTQLQSLDKYIFFGVGLGLHISAMASDISAEVYLIVEDDLELFRLSLFCTNYKKLAQDAELFFSIFEDDTEFSKTSEQFLQKSHFYNHYIKYFQLLSHSDDKVNKFYIAISTQSDLKFLFHDYMKISISPLQRVAEGYNTLLKECSFLNTTFQEKAFLLLASGPSLQNNISFLQKNRNNFIFVAVSSALEFLELHDIKPHIVVHLDPFDTSILSFEKLKDISFLDESLLCFAASSPKKLFEKFPKEQIFIYEAGSNYKADALNISAPCIGSLSYMLLLVLQVKNIYLLGLDLAVDSITGVDHTEIHQDTKKLALEDVFSKKETLSYKDDLFEIEGNIKERVYTTPHFYSSISIINRYFPKLKKEFQNVYNLSNGAKFNTATPLKPEEMTTLIPIPENSFSQIKELLLSYSEKKLKQTDKESLHKKFDYAKELTKTLQEHQIQNSDAKQYAQEINIIITRNKALYKYELARVLDSYLYYILNFIYNYFQNTNSTLHDFQTVDKLLKNNLLILISYYKDALEQVLQEEK